MQLGHAAMASWNGATYNRDGEHRKLSDEPDCHGDHQRHRVQIRRCGGGGGGAGPSTGSGGGGGGSDWLVTEVRPSSGPATGGTRALFIGYGLWGATSVTIGGVPAQSFTYIDAGTIEIVTPPGKVGWQDLVVMLPNGSAPAGFQ